MVRYLEWLTEEQARKYAGGRGAGWYAGWLDTQQCSLIPTLERTRWIVGPAQTEAEILKLWRESCEIQ